MVHNKKPKQLSANNNERWYADNDTIDLFALVFDEIEYNLKTFNIDTEFVFDVANRVILTAMQFNNISIEMPSGKIKIYKATNPTHISRHKTNIPQLTENKMTNNYSITRENFTRVNNDVNGNPRYVTHFLNLLNNYENYQSNLSLDQKYALALRKAKAIGGKKFHNKLFGGGIVFGSVYNLDDLVAKIQQIANS